MHIIFYSDLDMSIDFMYFRWKIEHSLGIIFLETHLNLLVQIRRTLSTINGKKNVIRLCGASIINLC